MSLKYSQKKLHNYYKNSYKLRQKSLAEFNKIFLIRALGGLAFLQNDGFSKYDFDELGNFLKVKQLIYLCPKNRAKLRRNASQRAISLSLNATFETEKSLKLTKVEEKYVREIEKLKTNGYLVKNIQDDLFLLALIFDQMHHGGIPSNAMAVKKALNQIKSEYRVIQIACENVPERLQTIKAHIESLLCLMETNNFKRIHHCENNECHSFPPIFSTTELDLFDTTQDSIYSIASDDFYLPSLNFEADPDRESELCHRESELSHYSLHPPFPIALIPRIRQSISQLISIKEKYRFQAYRFFQGLCNSQTCVGINKCESTLHILQQMETCFFGAKILLFTIKAYCSNIWLTSVMEEVKASGKFDLFKLCYLRVVSGSNAKFE